MEDSRAAEGWEVGRDVYSNVVTWYHKETEENTVQL
jgi:hypothetical protein